jgi:hypothetical protein
MPSRVATGPMPYGPLKKTPAFGPGFKQCRFARGGGAGPDTCRAFNPPATDWFPGFQRPVRARRWRLRSVQHLHHASRTGFSGAWPAASSTALAR